MKLIEYCFIVACASAFFLILMDKWGVREMMQIHGNRLISKMAGCTFCLGFWVSVIISVIFAIITLDAVYLVAPIISSPITRYIL